MPSRTIDPATGLVPVNFRLYSLKFTPYAHAEKENTGSIIQKVINHLSRERVANRGIIIDRRGENIKEAQRPLFATATMFDLSLKVIKCSLALLRVGKLPKIKPEGSASLVNLDAITKGSIAEETHIFIDYSTETVIMAIEFNNEGPRVSDIEFYFKVVARDTLKLAKTVKISLYIESSIEKTLSEFRNLLKMTLKIAPQNLSQVDTDIVGQYFTGITTLGQRVKPKFVKLEVMFQAPGKQQVKGKDINTDGNTMFKRLMKFFDEKPLNVDVFENFEVEYETNNGGEDKFNLLKGRKEITTFISPNTNPNAKEFFELIKDDFKAFVQFRK